MDVVSVTDSDEALLLDLLNSTPVVDGVQRDELGDHASAQAWMRSRGIPTHDRERSSLIEARSILQAVVSGEQSPSALAAVIGGVHYRAKATDAGVSWDLHIGRTGEAAVRAVLAWDRLRVSHPGRLRPCANSECRLFLVDRSHANTAKWCSMSACGNRMKARRHHGRSAARRSDS